MLELSYTFSDFCMGVGNSAKLLYTASLDRLFQMAGHCETRISDIIIFSTMAGTRLISTKIIAQYDVLLNVLLNVM